MCTAADQCTSCSTNYFLNDKTCATTCPSGTYQDKKSNQCLVCDGYILEDVNCVNKCPAGYGPDSTNKNCLACSANCDVCATHDTCTKCETGSYLQEGECVTTCQDGWAANTST
jgi:hypothetical protein